MPPDDFEQFVDTLLSHVIDTAYEYRATPGDVVRAMLEVTATTIVARHPTAQQYSVDQVLTEAIAHLRRAVADVVADDVRMATRGMVAS